MGKLQRVTAAAAILLTASTVTAAAQIIIPDVPPPGPGPGPLPLTGPMLAGALTGQTLSAIVYVPHSPEAPGGGEIKRYMFQAYMGPGGDASVRVWDTARDSYTPVARRRWELTGSKLCLDLSTIGPGTVCADIHVWGPRIAGIGTQPYAMLDGDLTPGNRLVSAR